MKHLLEPALANLPARRESAKIELLINGRNRSCRKCIHVSHPDTIAPTCNKFTHFPGSRKVAFVQNVQVPHFCHDTRRDEHGCGWDGVGYEEQSEKPVVFYGTKD